jgi:hypothetical protein
MGLLCAAALAGVPALPARRPEAAVAPAIATTTCEASTAPVMPSEVTAALSTAADSAALAYAAAVRLHG